MTWSKSTSVLLVPFSVLQIVVLLTESVNGGPVDPIINAQSSISEPNDKGVEVLSLKTAVSYPTADSSPTDYTLTIVAPIAAGIFLMVVAFFVYLVSEKNVASEATDYESLTEETEDESSERPSTSGAAGPSQVQVETATTS